MQEVFRVGQYRCSFSCVVGAVVGQFIIFILRGRCRGGSIYYIHSPWSVPWWVNLLYSFSVVGAVVGQFIIFILRGRCRGRSIYHFHSPWSVPWVALGCFG